MKQLLPFPLFFKNVLKREQLIRVYFSKLLYQLDQLDLLVKFKISTITVDIHFCSKFSYFNKCQVNFSFQIGKIIKVNITCFSNLPN